MLRILPALALSLSIAAPAFAQLPAEVRAGDSVRVKSGGFDGRFTVAEVHAESLMLRGPAGAIVEVPVESLRSLAVHRGRRSTGRGALRGLGYGSAAGAGVGILIGLASGDDQGGFISFTAEEKAVMAGIVLGSAGGLLGAVVGALAPGERWEKVQLAESTRVGMAGDGGVAVGYTLRF